MATVYITRFKSNAIADTAAGVPYLSIKISAAGCRWGDRGKENIGGGKNNALSGWKTMPEESAGALQTESLKVDKAKCAQHGKHYPHRISTL